MTIRYNNYTLEQCAKRADEIIKSNLHAKVYQKFSCDNCMARQTMPDANVFYVLGICEECGYVTDIKKTGCNYMVTYGVS